MKAHLAAALALLAICCLADRVQCDAKVIYVKPTGLDLNDGTTWTRAKKTVQAALNVAASGDEVWAAAGTYTENITLKNGVALYGGFAGTEGMLAQRDWRANRTILEGGLSGSVVTAPAGAGPSTRIDGFTIRNGKGTARLISGDTFYYGGGIYCRSSSPTIANNLITANTVQHLGGAIYCEHSSPVIAANMITGNSAGLNGAGIHCDNSSPTITDNIISGNAVTGGGTTGAQGGGVYCGASSSPKLINNTLAGNAAPAAVSSGGGVACASGASVVLVNNIIAYNSSGIYSAGSVTHHHNCVSKNTYFDYQGLEAGANDLKVDPLFVDRAAGNYHIQSASQCLDRGDDASVLTGWTDADGQARIYGMHVDIGADEYWPPTVTITYPTDEATYSTMSPNLSIAGKASEGVSSISWQNDRGGSGYCTGTTSWSASAIVLKPGQNVITVTARDDGGFASTDILTVTYNTGALANVVFVKTDGSDLSDGSTWQLAKRTIQAGINKAKAGEEVWVAAGAYGENITLKDGVAVYGGFSGSENARDERRFATNRTIIDGGGAGNAVRVSNDIKDNTRIDGFTIRNGASTNSGGIYCYNSHAVISNCVISGNSTVQGNGGGIYISGGAVSVINNVIAGNRADKGFGGGIYCWTCGGDTAIVNNTIVSNSASQGGAIYTSNCQTRMNIAGNIMAFNSSGIFCSGLAPTLTSNDIYGNVSYNYSGGVLPGQGDMSKDPEFVDKAGGDYHLRPISPCIDNGWTFAPGLATYDMDGQGRLRGPVDIGADESWPPAAVSITSPTADASWLTSTSSVNLSGTAAEGTVSVTWSSDRGASGACAGTTTWSADNVPLEIGTNTITVTSDSVESSARDVLVVYYDAAAPTVKITIPTTEPSYSSGAPRLDIGGTAADDTGIISVTWTNSRGGGGVCTGTTTWSAKDIGLLPGTNLISVTAMDAAAKTATAQISVTYTDTTPPVVIITGPTADAGYSTNQPKVTISGTAADDGGVKTVTWSSDHGDSGTCTGTASWSAGDVALAPGNTVITVTAFDTSGNSASDTITVTLDSSPPTVSIAGPTADPTYATHSATINLDGTASDDTGVASVIWANDRGGSGTCTGSASWSARAIALKTGDNVLTVTARDAAGNSATDTLKVTFTDTTPPTVTIKGPTDQAKYTCNTANLTLSGTALDDAGLAEVTWANDRGGSGTCTGAFNWSAADVVLKVGDNVITVSARDTSGNVGTDTLTVTFVDNTRPIISITSPTSADTWGRTCASIDLGGTASDDAGLASVTWECDSGGSGECSGGAQWTASGIALRDGKNVIAVTATDASGNSSSDTITVTCDPTVAPGNTWRGPAMVSLPIVPDEADPKSVIGFAQDYWLSYSPQTGYVRYPDRKTWFDPADATPGRGFWSYFASAPESPCGGIPPQDKPFALSLSAGWNLVGQPFTSSVAWDVDRLMVRESGGAERPLKEAGDSVASYAWGWDPAARQYYLVCDPTIVPGATATLEPWQAYWIRAYKTCELVLPAP